jgi:hypothetical protein
MAADLSTSPISGIPVIIDGDAHLSNIGFYGTPQREVVFDLNDFDEVTIGPWEWDLKRLVASVNVAGRENGLKPARTGRCGATRCRGLPLQSRPAGKHGIAGYLVSACLSRTVESPGQD